MGRTGTPLHFTPFNSGFELRAGDEGLGSRSTALSGPSSLPVAANRGRAENREGGCCRAPSSPRRCILPKPLSRAACRRCRARGLKGMFFTRRTAQICPQSSAQLAATRSERSSATHLGRALPRARIRRDFAPRDGSRPPPSGSACPRCVNPAVLLAASLTQPLLPPSPRLPPGFDTSWPQPPPPGAFRRSRSGRDATRTETADPPDGPRQPNVNVPSLDSSPDNVYEQRQATTIWQEHK